MLLYVNAISTQSFSIVPALVDTTLEMRMTGSGDGAAVVPLKESLTAIKSELSRDHVTAVIFDVRTLYLLNSSCLKCLASFIFDVKSAGTNCAIRFLVNAKLSWQSRALIALERLAPGIVSIEQI